VASIASERHSFLSFLSILGKDCSGSNSFQATEGTRAGRRFSCIYGWRCGLWLGESLGSGNLSTFSLFFLHFTLLLSCTRDWRYPYPFFCSVCCGFSLPRVGGWRRESFEIGYTLLVSLERGIEYMAIRCALIETFGENNEFEYSCEAAEGRTPGFTTRGVRESSISICGFVHHLVRNGHSWR